METHVKFRFDKTTGEAFLAVDTSIPGARDEVKHQKQDAAAVEVGRMIQRDPIVVDMSPEAFALFFSGRAAARNTVSNPDSPTSPPPPPTSSPTITRTDDQFEPPQPERQTW